MDHALKDEAQRWGVEPGYHDVFGNWHEVPFPTLRAITDALSEGRAVPAPLGPVGREMRAFQGDGRRLWGLTLQLYAVRSQRNWGIGDFRDLRDIVSMAARAGAAAIGLNPLHALFLDRPELASPYAPNSRLFLNPLYIAVDELDWFDPTDAPAPEIEAVRRCELVGYRRVSKLKRAALRTAYDRMTREGASQPDFVRFRDERGESLRRFACFEVLRARHSPSSWLEWPAPWSHPSDRDIAALYRSELQHCGFVEFMQWIADRQLAQCSREAARSGLPIGLYLDLAVGVEPSGADAWSNQRAVMSALSIGAPPDEFNPGGQNWGLVPFNPHALPADDFAIFRQLLAATMRHAGAVRLDHVLGLMRLYLIPRDGGEHGAYVRYPFEHSLRVVAEESDKYRCIFIGEDLGTVPEGFRDTAARWGVWSYRVMMFERSHNGAFKPPQDYPAEALATFSTHDLPTFSGWMGGSDIVTKRAIGVAAESDDDRATARDALRTCVAAYAGEASTDRIAAAAGFLAATPSRLVTVTIDDLLNVSEQANIPGTVEQHPNWRRKLPLPLDQWEAQPAFAEVVATFRRAGRAASS
jgi:4-alpha-glucanotransferase